MTRLVFNRNGGSADEYGHLQGLNRLITGDVIEGMQVQALSSPNMTVVVGQGSCRISTGTYPTSYGYFSAIDTTTGSPAGESVTITTAPSSNSRIDTIVAYVDTTLTPSSGTPNNPSMLKVAAVAGTVAASPSAPTNSAIQSAIGASNPYIVLANIAVGTSVTQINSGNITDKRTMATISKNNIGFATFTTTGSITAGSSGWNYVQLQVAGVKSIKVHAVHVASASYAGLGMTLGLNTTNSGTPPSNHYVNDTYQNSTPASGFDAIGNSVYFARSYTVGTAAHITIVDATVTGNQTLAQSMTMVGTSGVQMTSMSSNSGVDQYLQRGYLGFNAPAAGTITYAIEYVFG